ncbi:hypothetical protein DFJ77DRAFT_445642 [Powellomyces hirtus]|nr:hypothetical protein DFJ77DRAFT_445642 [Powellomyces hirtus]
MMVPLGPSSSNTSPDPYAEPSHLDDALNLDMDQFLNLDSTLASSKDGPDTDATSEPSVEAPSTNLGFDLMPLFPFDLDSLPVNASIEPKEMEQQESMGAEDEAWCHVDPSAIFPDLSLDPSAALSECAEHMSEAEQQQLAQGAATWGPGLVDPSVFSQNRNVHVKQEELEEVNDPEPTPENDNFDRVDESASEEKESRIKQEIREAHEMAELLPVSVAVPAKPAKRAPARKRRRTTPPSEDGGHDEDTATAGSPQDVKFRDDKYSLDKIGYGLDDLRRFVDELDRDTTISAKEKRQLRNKLSARNFRVRRKEYVSQLEDQLAQLGSEKDTLLARNKELEAENRELIARLAELTIAASASAPASPRESPIRTRTPQNSAATVVTPPLVGTPPPFHSYHPQHRIQVHTVHVPTPTYTPRSQDTKAAATSFLDLVTRLAAADTKPREIPRPASAPPRSSVAQQALRNAYESLKLGGPTKSPADSVVRDILAVAVLAAKGLVVVQ